MLDPQLLRALRYAPLSVQRVAEAERALRSLPLRTYSKLYIGVGARIGELFPVGSLRHWEPFTVATRDMKRALEACKNGGTLIVIEGNVRGREIDKENVVIEMGEESVVGSVEKGAVDVVRMGKTDVKVWKRTTNEELPFPKWREKKLLIGKYSMNNFAPIKGEDGRIGELLAVAEKNVDARKEIGLMFLRGDGVEQSFSMAHDWLLKSGLKDDETKEIIDVCKNEMQVEEKQMETQCKVGYYAKDGLKWIIKSAEKGFAASQRLYALNLFEEKQNDQALKWLKISAQQDDCYSQGLLGAMYQSGVVVDKKPQKGFKWLEKASKNGNLLACHEVGQCYMTGNGVPKNEQTAVNYYAKAADSGVAKSCRALGVCLLNGIGTEKNTKEGKQRLAQAIKYGDNVARSLLDDQCQQEMKACPKPEPEFEDYLMMAKRGDTDSMIKLVEFYRKGMGIRRNFEMAFEWAMKAAERDNAVGMFRVGKYYLKGKGVEVNHEKGLEWLHKASDRSVPRAQLLLGQLYIRGAGVPRNREKGIQLICSAADLGDTRARLFLHLDLDRYLRENDDD